MTFDRNGNELRHDVNAVKNTLNMVGAAKPEVHFGAQFPCPEKPRQTEEHMPHAPTLSPRKSVAWSRSTNPAIITATTFKARL